MSDYAKQKWQTTHKATAYKKSREASHSKRTLIEDQILSGWLAELKKGSSILDCPCGTGRFTSLITQQGFNYTGADISLAMIEEAKKSAGTSSAAVFFHADAENLPFPDNSFDCVIVWRLFHHISEPAVRVRILSEAARVARHKVLVSFYHPCSFTYFRLLVKSQFSRKKKLRNALTHWRLRREAQECGLIVSQTKSFQKFISINWFASLTKTQAV